MPERPGKRVVEAKIVPSLPAHIKNETPKSALGDRKPKRRFPRQFPHTETESYLRNAAVPRGF
jgi:hypothetical protein